MPLQIDSMLHCAYLQIRSYMVPSHSALGSRDFARLAQNLTRSAAQKRAQKYQELREFNQRLDAQLSQWESDCNVLSTVPSKYKKFTRDNVKLPKSSRLDSCPSGTRRISNISKGDSDKADLFSTRRADFILGGIVERFVYDYFSDRFSDHFDEFVANWEIVGSRITVDRKNATIYWRPLNGNICEETLNQKMNNLAADISRRFSHSVQAGRKTITITFSCGIPPPLPVFLKVSDILQSRPSEESPPPEGGAKDA